jgi:hypothetical protein
MKSHGSARPGKERGARARAGTPPGPFAGASDAAVTRATATAVTRIPLHPSPDSDASDDDFQVGASLDYEADERSQRPGEQCRARRAWTRLGAILVQRYAAALYGDTPYWQRRSGMRSEGRAEAAGRLPEPILIQWHAEVIHHTGSGAVAVRQHLGPDSDAPEPEPV